METPTFSRSIFGEDFKDVYEPAEDSFLLLDALEKDLHSLRAGTKIFVECGSGSGVIITALSKAVKGIFFATDINPKACTTTLKCARSNFVDNIQVVNTKYLDGLMDRLEHSVDVVIFNPPYVPTDEPPINDIDRSWAGGVNGREVIDEFLLNHLPKLLKKPDGCAYIVAVKQNRIEEMLNLLLHIDIIGEVVLSRKAGIEHLYILKYKFKKLGKNKIDSH